MPTHLGRFSRASICVFAPLLFLIPKVMKSSSPPGRAILGPFSATKSSPEGRSFRNRALTRLFGPFPRPTRAYFFYSFPLLGPPSLVPTFAQLGDHFFDLQTEGINLESPPSLPSLDVLLPVWRAPETASAPLLDFTDLLARVGFSCGRRAQTAPPIRPATSFSSVSERISALISFL